MLLLLIPSCSLPFFLYLLRATPMTWTSEKDEALCKKILLLEPFRFRPRTKESGTTWSQVAEDLRQIKSLNILLIRELSEIGTRYLSPTSCKR